MPVIVGALLLAIVLFRDAPAMVARWTGEASPWPVTLGISFVVLRLVGVVMDVSALGVPVGLRHLLLLSLFFPTYRAGPITTLQSLRYVTGDVDYARAADRILVGLVRKRLLADYLRLLVVSPWMTAGVTQLNPEQCLLLPFALGLWVYWDFAGYSDMAIGVAALLGYRIPENFDHPYQSRNVTEFWRRWHITLSEWIRQRLFLKITGRRASTPLIYLAAVGSMLAVGLWHGVRPGFLLWGLWHGVGIAVVLAVGAAAPPSRARSRACPTERGLDLDGPHVRVREPGVAAVLPSGRRGLASRRQGLPGPRAATRTVAARDLHGLVVLGVACGRVVVGPRAPGAGPRDRLRDRVARRLRVRRQPPAVRLLPILMSAHDVAVTGPSE
jgi:hypothetical protein